MLFSYEEEDIGRFSNLHQRTFKKRFCVRPYLFLLRRSIDVWQGLNMSVILVTVLQRNITSYFLHLDEEQTLNEFPIPPKSNSHVSYDVLFLSSMLASPAGNYIFKVNNRNTRTRCEICSKLTIKASERRHWVALMSLLLTLNIFHTFF